MYVKGNWLAMPVLLVSLCALPGGSAAEGSSPNPHLRNTHSAYLQRAIRQPVDWYPWGAEAWQRAQETGRPILLDLGAIWCSFCEQMDRESYSRPDTAEFINQHFVAVKVDYDSQPELAARLERAQAVLNLPAGLPLTAFLSPSGKLYFGGGYFPPRPLRGKPAFRQVLDQALRIYREQRTEIERDGFDVTPGE
jgi:uncharacterized protein